uniref:NADH-ubiquinone oxidoreductase chain 5 n=3 Tax=Vanhornia eucnemidarum TaxID=32432 RepID=Q0H2F5_9HYME|nr:NADH dehydrogenase subunit 5 [Vanhornia eucnemidarum]
MIMLYYIFFFFFFGMVYFILGIYFLYNQNSMFIEWNLFMINSMEVNMLVLLDMISLLFIVLFLLISSMIFLYSSEYMIGDNFIDRFVYLMIMFIISMIMMILSPNLFTILLGWDGLGLISYCLIIYYQNYKSLKSGMLTILMNRLGDLSLVISIGLMVYIGSWNFIFYYDLSVMLFLMVIFSGMSKSAQLPLSSWLPAAMAAPTPVSSLVHSSTLVTAGIYLLIRFNLSLYNYYFMNILMILSLLTMFFFGMSANYEYDLKKIIAFSTLSQLGMMLMLLCMGMDMLSFFHLLVHALFKSLLFMCVGMIIHSMMDSQDIRFMGSLVKFFPMLMMIFNISSLSLCGIPYMSGFYSKDLMLESSLMMDFNLVILIVFYLSIGLTISYSMRLVNYSFVSYFKFNSLYNISENKLVNISLFFLMVMSVISGSMLWWLMFSSISLVYLSLFLKLLVIIILFIGFNLGYFIMNNIYLLEIKCDLNKKLMYGSMWFYTYLSLFMINKFFFMNFKMNFFFEKGWLEYLISMNLNYLFKSYFLSQLIFMNKYMMLIKMLIYLVLLYIILF